MHVRVMFLPGSINSPTKELIQHMRSISLHYSSFQEKHSSINKSVDTAFQSAFSWHIQAFHMAYHVALSWPPHNEYFQKVTRRALLYSLALIWLPNGSNNISTPELEPPCFLCSLIYNDAPTELKAKSKSSRTRLLPAFIHSRCGILFL